VPCWLLGRKFKYLNFPLFFYWVCWVGPLQFFRIWSNRNFLFPSPWLFFPPDFHFCP
jgi:hypothetical protein